MRGRQRISVEAQRVASRIHSGKTNDVAGVRLHDGRRELDVGCAGVHANEDHTIGVDESDAAPKEDHTLDIRAPKKAIR